jgi:hypothetical protein
MRYHLYLVITVCVRNARAYVMHGMGLVGRAVAQAVSRRLPTATARARSWSSHVVFVVDRAALGTGSLRVLQFPLPLIHFTNCSTIFTIYHPGLIQLANK